MSAPENVRSSREFTANFESTTSQSSKSSCSRFCSDLSDAICAIAATIWAIVVSVFVVIAVSRPVVYSRGIFPLYTRPALLYAPVPVYNHYPRVIPIHSESMTASCPNLPRYNNRSFMHR